MWIFRDGKKQVQTRDLVRELEHLISRCQFALRDELIDVLIRGGELEAGLADQESPAAAVFKNLTDRAAYALIQDREVEKLFSFCAILNQLELPPTLLISPPEGFAYYALEPLDFAESAATLAKPGTSYAVVGIRSIGTTLSAVVTAALKARGAYAERITVRPTGHPYNRVTQLNEEERRWVECHLSLGDKFLVVDEGPGLSGSSLLSVGEVLLQSGVPSERVTLLGSREPEVKALRARDAVRRWSRFAWRRAQGEAFERMREFLYVGGGIWRAHLLRAQPDWPASWTQMERLKFVSPDRKWFVKFEGLGRFGKKAKEHASRLNHGGFGCEVYDAGNGLMAYPFAPGPSLRAEHLSPAVLDRLAEYCAFRAREFKLQEAQSFQQLEDMLRFNLIEEFGGGEQAAELWDTTRDREYVFPEIAPGTLATVNPVLVDGRMQPHEWLLQDGTMIKSDGSSHGDDHFFPGPTDIAWDLAGAMVEWEMDSHAAEFFLARYALWSGDDPRPRLPGFLLAYTVFRMGYCKMAFEAEAGSGEQSRLHHAYEHYRNRAQRLASFPFELRKMTATVAKGTPQVQSQ